MFDTIGILLLVFSVVSFLLIPLLGYGLYRFREKKRYQNRELTLHHQQVGMAKYSNIFLLYLLIFLLFATIVVLIFCVGMLATGTGLIS